MTTPVIYRGHVILPSEPRLEVLVPHAKKLRHSDGHEYLLVPHKLDESKVLRNLGYDVKPPILTAYDWCGTTPFDAQRVTAAMISMHPRCFVLNDIGTGKTRAALFGFDYLRREGAVNRLLVTAPLSTLRPTWAREVMTCLPHLKVSVLYGTRARRLRALEESADVYVINHDGVETILGELMARTDIDMMVLDELTVYKTATTDRWKKTQRLTARMKRVVGMTGTPMPAAPSDVYGQARIVAPSVIPESFTRFRERVMHKITAFKWVAKHDALDTVLRTLQPSVRFKRDECYDLPDCQYVDREAELSREQAALYQQIAGECAAQVAAGEIKAVNESDRINKLLQVALGAVLTRTKTVQSLDVTPRMRVLLECIESSASKTIVFVPYRAPIEDIRAHLESKGHTVGVVHGDVTPAQRESIFYRFMNTPDPGVLVAHPRTMSHGLTLTAASTIVWYGPPQSLEEYEQANGRITRAGQRHAQLIYHIAATKVEQRIFTRLQNRASVQGVLLELFEAQELDVLL